MLSEKQHTDFLRFPQTKKQHCWEVNAEKLDYSLIENRDCQLFFNLYKEFYQLGKNACLYKGQVRGQLLV